jgi:ribonuclease Y
MSDPRDEYLKKLEKVASLTRDQAKVALLEEVEKDLADELSRRIQQAQEDYTARASEIARDIIVESMIHGATSYTAEYSVSIVNLPNEGAKGSIIGQGGRNIAAFEKATGVELEIDEGASIRLSCFDSVRREVAKRSLEVLIKDGRIHPGRIEEVVNQTKKSMDFVLIEEGNKICKECGVFSLDPELVKIIGRYRFRFSYGQNLGIHTIEETKIGVQIASEIGLSDEQVYHVRLGCLLHDVGKVITEEEGTHVQLGVELIKKFSMPAPVIAAVAEHHEDKPFSSVVSRIVWIADAISGSRPGARYEPHEAYVKRMQQIEDTGKSFRGVENVFAFQAGRDVRVLVRPEAVSDSELTVLVSKIKEKLEKEVTYAGQIKVTGIREVRATDITKAK